MKLDEKFILRHSYYLANLIDTGTIEEAIEYEEIIDELRELEKEYIEDIVLKNYEPYELTKVEREMIEKGLEDYSSWGLITDWSVGIEDFNYDTYILNLIQHKAKTENYDDVLNRLYAAVILIERNLK